MPARNTSLLSMSTEEDDFDVSEFDDFEEDEELGDDDDLDDDDNDGDLGGDFEGDGGADLRVFAHVRSSTPSRGTGVV